MANIKSAKKRILVAETRAARNKAIRSKVKTAVKKVEAAVAAKDKAAAQAALLAATSEIDKATSKGVYHKNTASRKVSRLSKAVNTGGSRLLSVPGNSGADSYTSQSERGALPGTYTHVKKAPGFIRLSLCTRRSAASASTDTGTDMPALSRMQNITTSR